MKSLRSLLALAVCLMAAACTMPAPSPPPSRPLTAAQSYYAADRAYESVLAAAVDYHEDCQRRPDVVKNNCRAVVQVLRRVNREAQDMRLLAEMAIADGDEDLVTEATNHLETLRDRLRQEVVAQMERDGKTPNLE